MPLYCWHGGTADGDDTESLGLAMSSEGEAPLVRNNAGMMGRSQPQHRGQIARSCRWLACLGRKEIFAICILLSTVCIVRWCFEQAIGRNFLINKQTLDMDINN